MSQAQATIGAALSGFFRGLLSGVSPPRPARRRAPQFGAGARFTAKTANRKLAPVKLVQQVGLIRQRPVPVGPFCAATSSSIEATCQDSCPFKGSGCFADAGFTRIQSVQMNREASRLTGLEVARQEAALIDAAFARGVPQDGARGGRDLRLHVGGDASGPAAAKLLAAAADRFRARGGGAVWTFTHAWRSIPRSAWGGVAALASVETNRQAMQAHRAGYAPAIVVESFPNGDKAWDIGGELKAVPCPAETRGKTCVECRLCLDRDLVAMKRAIAFRVHGPDADEALRALQEAS